MRNKKLIPLGILASTMAVSVSAGPILQQVVAHFNPAIQYTLNGESVLEGQGALVYNDSTYVPVRAIAETLGVEVVFENGVVKMVTEKDVAESGSLTESTPATEVTTPAESKYDYEKMEIIEIHPESKSFVMAPIDSEDEELKVVVRTSEDTNVAHFRNKAAYRFEDLTVGQVVAVKTTGIATKSIPAQVIAVDVVMLDAEKEVDVKPEIPAELFDTHPVLKEADYKNMVVVDVDLESKQLVMSPFGTDEKAFENQIIVKLSEDTNVSHYLNRARYTIEAIEKGQIICVKSTGISTMSLPPQIAAQQVILID